MPMTRAERVSIHKKQERMLLKDGVPLVRELQEGVPTLRSTSEGVVEYVSYGGALYQNVFSKSTRTSVPVKSAFGVYQSTSADAQTIADSTHTRINFDTKEYDLGNDYDVSEYKFIAPVNGIYHFDARITWDNNVDATAGDWTAGETQYIYLRKNDDSATPSGGKVAVDIDKAFGTVTDVLLMNNLSVDLKLSTGDYITVSAWQNSGTNQYTYDPSGDSIYTTFTGHLIQEA